MLKDFNQLSSHFLSLLMICSGGLKFVYFLWFGHYKVTGPARLISRPNLKLCKEGQLD